MLISPHATSKASSLRGENTVEEGGIEYQFCILNTSIRVALQAIRPYPGGILRIRRDTDQASGFKTSCAFQDDCMDHCATVSPNSPDEHTNSQTCPPPHYSPRLPYNNSLISKQAEMKDGFSHTVSLDHVQDQMCK
ncbi:uncharacterized protein H6S33_003852 [Morchella sextelata]|uniref:uncharacterized protein n=1 Tax=Morchella sextelata TaxID=1174677 RepID=UPI001D042FF4|nr:uncharacterized protein H6S33_003852 [Morchella sextelata]KAH0606191.1 hypothetical protein H6S33_003852 [Morchella sextelata]